MHFLGNFQRLTIDEDAWTNRMRTLSAVFNQFPSINYSAVDLDMSDGGFYLVNTEGTEVREPENVTVLRARAMAQAPDGMNIADGVSFHALDAARMPSDAEMIRGITAMAQNIVALQAAPKGEDYTGPVVFEGLASAQILAEVLGRNLALSRRPLGGAGAEGGEEAWLRRPASWKAASARAFCPIPSMWWTIPRRRNGAAGRFSAATTWIAKA